MQNILKAPRANIFGVTMFVIYNALFSTKPQRNALGFKAIHCNRYHIRQLMTSLEYLYSTTIISDKSHVLKK